MACKPDSVADRDRMVAADGHSSGRRVATALLRPSRSLFGLAPDGACRATLVAEDAMGSYPTVSPLPRESRGRLFSVALSLGSPRAGVTRRHFSLESGLSSKAVAGFRDHPAIRGVQVVGTRGSVNGRTYPAQC